MLCTKCLYGVERVKSVDVYKFQILEKLKTKTKIPVTINVPSVIHNDIKIFIETCRINGTNLQNLFSLIFVNGYLMYKRFINNGIFSIMEMNFIISYFNKIYDGLVEYSQESWFMNHSAIAVAVGLCGGAKDANIGEFLEFINQNRIAVIGDVVLLKPVHVKELFKIYIRKKRNGR